MLFFSVHELEIKKINYNKKIENKIHYFSLIVVILCLLWKVKVVIYSTWYVKNVLICFLIAVHKSI